MQRRDFCRAGTSCLAHALVAGGLLPLAARQSFGATLSGRPVRAEPWGNLERMSDGIWAMVSTPLAGGPEARRTFSNGGIVAGRSGVLVVEGFASREGAQWMARTAAELTGRPPTHAVLTHYHGDHSAGLAGYLGSGAGPTYVTTEHTRDRVGEMARSMGRGEELVQALRGARVIAPGATESIDLGGRRVQLTARSGHTGSDITVAVDDPRIVFGGDLLWNGFFPNYVDATPSVLSREVKVLTAERQARYVPGHGSLPRDREVRHYVELLDLVEAAARRAHERGASLDEAADAFRLPPSLGDWTRFSERYYRVALGAWAKELAAPSGGPEAAGTASSVNHS